MKETEWFNTAAADQEGFRLLIGTRAAFRAIRYTMIPLSFIEEYFETGTLS
jgi:hypothetical protein